MLNLMMLGWSNQWIDMSRTCNTLWKIRNACNNSLLVLNHRDCMEDGCVAQKASWQKQCVDMDCTDLVYFVKMRIL